MDSLAEHVAYAPLRPECAIVSGLETPRSSHERALGRAGFVRFRARLRRLGEREASVRLVARLRDRTGRLRTVAFDTIVGFA